MTKILINIPIKPDVLQRIRALPNAEIVVVDPSNDGVTPLPLEVISGAEVLVCHLPPVNQAEMKDLKLVQIMSAGFNQLAAMKLAERGVRACNAGGVYNTAIGEWTIAMMIALTRDLRGMIRNQDTGVWDRDDRFAAEIRGRTLGLWGYGGLGREVARLARVMGLTVHVLARSPIGRRDDTYAVPGTGDPEGSLPDKVFGPEQDLAFLGGIDYLVLAMPLNPANTGRIGARELRAMKPTAYLLNPARGPLVNEAALLRALSEGWIAGAALDTHFRYPMPADHPLWRMPNVIMTPHISGSDKGPHFLDRMGEIVEHNVAAYLEGRPLWNEIAPSEL
ncbi:MAG TPA: NAD(P)-dependent oxidoreductase [Thermoflexales bacterium]|nr:NAD(P)-dependent oxidoreductase [Thermoflexales bacterium]